jgi:hypothetical protein
MGSATPLHRLKWQEAGEGLRIFRLLTEDVKRNVMMYLEANIVSNVRTDFRLR